MTHSPTSGSLHCLNIAGNVETTISYRINLISSTQVSFRRSLAVATCNSPLVFDEGSSSGRFIHRGCRG